eukprot:COSAG01_NODE_3909_length_5551_cov_21.369155_1_plen_64_part_10
MHLTKCGRKLIRRQYSSHNDGANAIVVPLVIWSSRQATNVHFCTWNHTRSTELCEKVLDCQTRA